MASEDDKANDLLPGLDVTAEAYDAEEQRGNYTLERLRRYHPAKLEAIATMLAEGMGIRSICRALKCHPYTVQAVQVEEGATIETLKQRASQRLGTFVQLASERLIDEADKIPLNVLPTALGIATDKLLLLNDQATTITERRHTVDPDAFNRYLAGLPSAAPAETDQGEGTRSPKEAPEIEAETLASGCLPPASD